MLTSALLSLAALLAGAVVCIYQFADQLGLENVCPKDEFGGDDFENPTIVPFRGMIRKAKEEHKRKEQQQYLLQQQQQQRSGGRPGQARPLNNIIRN